MPKHDREPPYVELQVTHRRIGLVGGKGTALCLLLHLPCHEFEDDEWPVPGYDWSTLVTPEALKDFAKEHEE